MRGRKYFAPMLICVAFVLLLAGCGGKSGNSKAASNAPSDAQEANVEVSESDKYGGDLVMASNLPLNNLYGLVRQGNTYNWVFPAVEKLAVLQLDGSFKPLLADSHC